MGATLTHEALANIADTTLANLDEFQQGKRGAELTNAVMTEGKPENNAQTHKDRRMSATLVPDATKVTTADQVQRLAVAFHSSNVGHLRGEICWRVRTPQGHHQRVALRGK